MNEDNAVWTLLLEAISRCNSFKKEDRKTGNNGLYTVKTLLMAFPSSKGNDMDRGYKRFHEGILLSA
jgi:hypothetical protein